MSSINLVSPSTVWNNAKAAQVQNRLQIGFTTREAFLVWVQTQPLEHPDYKLRLTTNLHEPDCTRLHSQTSALVPFYVAKYLSTPDSTCGEVFPSDDQKGRWMARGGVDVPILDASRVQCYRAPFHQHVRRGRVVLGYFATPLEARACTLNHRADELDAYANLPRFAYDPRMDKTHPKGGPSPYVADALKARAKNIRGEAAKLHLFVMSGDGADPREWGGETYP